MGHGSLVMEFVSNLQLVLIKRFPLVYVLGHGSWDIGDGSWVMGHGSWSISHGSWVMGSLNLFKTLNLSL